MDCSLPGSSVHGVSQASILEWVAMPSSRGSSRCRDQTQVCGLAGGSFTTEPPGKPQLALVLFKKKKKNKTRKLCNRVQQFCLAIKPDDMRWIQYAYINYLAYSFNEDRGGNWTLDQQ